MPIFLKRRLLLLLSLLLLAGAWLLLGPAAIAPVAYKPPAAPALEGVFEPNAALTRAEILVEGEVIGPEDIAVDTEGRIYGGTLDGRIVRLTDDRSGGWRLESFAETGGRPLGLHFGADGRLLVADADRGLLAISPQGETTVLATETEGRPFRFTDDLDIARDGTIYFSDASWKRRDYLLDLLESRPYGRLMRYSPETGGVETLLSDLHFANGIALSRNEDFVLVNETFRYRVTRYWLQGPKAGTSDVFLDNLPCFPDGISSNRRGTFWIACFTVRNPIMDTLHPSAMAKRALSKLPDPLWPKAARYGLVLAADESGSIRRSLHDPGGETIPQVTSVEEVAGFLYLGNLEYPFIARLAL